MHGPATYQIRVEGLLEIKLGQQLEGMNISHTGSGTSVIVGRLEDQAALAGVMTTLYNLQYPVASVTCLEVG